jgi:hypothetical protein
MSAEGEYNGSINENETHDSISVYCNRLLSFGDAFGTFPYLEVRLRNRPA